MQLNLTYMNALLSSKFKYVYQSKISKSVKVKQCMRVSLYLSHFQWVYLHVQLGVCKYIKLLFILH